MRTAGPAQNDFRRLITSVVRFVHIYRYWTISECLFDPMRRYQLNRSVVACNWIVRLYSMKWIVCFAWFIFVRISFYLRFCSKILCDIEPPTTTVFLYLSRISTLLRPCVNLFGKAIGGRVCDKAPPAIDVILLKLWMTSICFASVLSVDVCRVCLNAIQLLKYGFWKMDRKKRKHWWINVLQKMCVQKKIDK